MLDPAVIAAVVASVGSLAVALLAAYFGRRAQQAAARLDREVAGYKSQLEERLAVGNARRDYEYEARKRLYAECEPLLFQARELGEIARSRVLSLARSSREGDLRPDGTGWLADEGYYFRSSSFYLLAPLTAFKILRQRLTRMDVNLEPRLQVEYDLLKLLFRTFADDFELARQVPVLDYDPDRADPGEPGRDALRSEDPATYVRQGFYFGDLENVVDGLSITDANGQLRCKTFGEFELAVHESQPDVTRTLEPLREVFGGFHPRTRPVLWRVLLAQALLYDMFLGSKLTTEASHVEGRDALLIPRPPADVDDFSWSVGDSTSVSPIDQFGPSIAYLETRLRPTNVRLSASRNDPGAARVG